MRHLGAGGIGRSCAALWMALLLLTGCATTTASLPLRQCRLPVAPLALPIPTLNEGPATEGTGGGEAPLSPFATTVRGRIGASRAAPGGLESAAVPVRALVLSGGGEWGAFGTGFLTAWPSLPRFDVVTGVSTGALQATFAFLGNRAAPANPALTTALDFPAGSGKAGRRYVEDLLAGYGITRQESLYRSSGTSGIIRRAAQGTLDPLRARLERLITPDVLDGVAEEAASGRQLWVAVLNWNSGDTEAVDMAALAGRVRGGQPFATVRDCYIDALIAAASEPLGARPERLDASVPAVEGLSGLVPGERLYFDAGLRYGVFLDELRRSLAGGVGAELYVIVNGDLAVAPWDEPKWNALDLAGRGRKVLVNQVYRFSTYDLLRRQGDGVTVRLAYVAGAPLEQCSAIRRGEVGPDTFHPAFMRCLVGEGQRRGAAQIWQQ